MGMLHEKPLVSVYIPTRNRSALLRRAIASVFAQTYSEVELVVVDDGSTDDTASVLEEFAANGRPIRYVVNSQSMGAPAARNLAINMARGEFITGLDDDDEFLPDRIQIFLDNYNDSVSCLSTCLIEKGQNYVMRVQQSARYIDSEQIRRKNLVGNQIFTRSDRPRELGGFDEQMQAWQDYDLWVRMIDRFGPALKLSACSYVLNRSDSVKRISNSENARIGYEQFIARHGNSMTPEQLQHQRINDLHNRSVRLRFSEFAALWNRDTSLQLFALVLKAYAPRLYRLLIKIHICIQQTLRPAIHKLRTALK
jgi:glycosyltransferase involved in cell wall biosynthesis